jgi:Domain of unknown function (DUF4160)
MPTVERWRGYRFCFYSHEPNEPPHVHADARGSTAKFWLQPVSLARNIGFAPRELTELLARVRQRRTAFLEAWHGHFGP